MVFRIYAFLGGEAEFNLTGIQRNRNSTEPEFSGTRIQKLLNYSGIQRNWNSKTSQLFQKKIWENLLKNYKVKSIQEPQYICIYVTWLG